MSAAEEESNTDICDYDSETASLNDEERTELNQALKKNLESVLEKRNQPFELPETVSILNCQNGTTVYLIGTAHFSEESIRDVSKVMKQVCPDFVVVELCRNRAHVLVMDEENIKETMKNHSFFEFIKSHGASNGLLQFLLLRLNAYLVKTLGMAPGGEFRAAAQEAVKQMHCHVILGDRPVGITLQRAFDALGPWTKLKLFFTLLMEFKPVTKEQIEEMKKSDFLEKIMTEMAGEQPELTRILLDERDMYLTRSIWSTTGMTTHKPSSKSTDTDHSKLTDPASSGDRDAVLSNAPESSDLPVEASTEQIPACCKYWPSPSVVPRVVVAVVGIGHAAGIKKYWERADTINQAELMSVLEPPLSWKAFKWTARGLLLSSIVGLGYGFVKGSYYLGCAALKYFR